jgi:hypothetical protein
MLEEALKKNEKSPQQQQQQPAEVALLALQFLESQLPAGGASAETRFFRLFVPLCSAVFGPILLDKEVLYRHGEGGWMSAQYAWSRNVSNNNASSSALGGNRRPPTSSSVGIAHHRIQTSSSSSSTLDDFQADPVFRLLLGASNNKANNNPSLITAISKEATFAFPLHFNALPKTTRDAWMALVEASLSGQSVNVNPSICSPNTARLLGEMSRRRPSEQTELIEYRARQMAPRRNENYSTISPQTAPPHLFQSPMASQHTPGFYSPTSSAAAATTATSPVATAAATTTTPSNKMDQEPKVIFGMLEYYLILFLRYPHAVPVPKSSSTTPAPQGYTHSSQRRTSSTSTPSSSRPSTRREPVPYGERLYVALFRNYVKHFLPWERDENRHINFSSSSIATTSTAGNRNDSEFFLRATIALWMETQGQVKSTRAMVESMLLQRRRHHHHPAHENVDFLNLNASYDLIQVVAYDPPPQLIQQCLRYLIAQVISDPTLHAQVVAISSSGQLQQRQQQRAGETTPGGVSLSSSSPPSLSSSCWSLTSALTALQQPFYNIIRTNLRYAAIHSSDSPFFSALSLWLLWLEPWNVKECKCRLLRM